MSGRCPRCHAKTLFEGPVAFADSCRACGLDFSAFNVGDGPAAFLTLIIGTAVVVGAIWLELAVSPPWWGHALIWPVLTLALVVWGLRLAKSKLIASEYRNSAREGRIK